MNISSYQSVRGLAKVCDTTHETISRIAGQLKLGTPGPHKNSPRVFRPDEGARVMEAFYDEQTGHFRNQEMLTKAEIVTQAERMSQLAGLAAGMGHPAAQELRELGEVVARIRKGTGSKPELKSVDGKARFLNSLNPHFSALVSALNNTYAKI